MFRTITKEQVERMIPFIKLYGQPDINEQASQQLTELSSNLHNLNSSNPGIAATAFSKVEFLYNDLINKTQFDRRFLLMWRDAKQRDSLVSFYELAYNHAIKVYPTLVKGEFIKFVFLMDEAAKAIGKFLKLKLAVEKIEEKFIDWRDWVIAASVLNKKDVFPNLTHPEKEKRIEAISRLQSIYENLIKSSQFDMKAIIELGSQQPLCDNLFSMAFNTPPEFKDKVISVYNIISKAPREIDKLRQDKIIPPQNPYLPLYTTAHQASFQPAEEQFFPTLFRDMVLLEKIEEDSVSVIYKAAYSSEWTTDGKYQGPFYAVKRYRKSLSPDQVEVVNNEMQTTDCLRSIAHPNLIKTHQTIRDEDKMALVYEYCSFGNLQQYLAARKQNPPSSYEVTLFVKELVSAVAKLHSLHLVHQNLSTANILLFADAGNRNITLKLGDYRLAESSFSKESKDNKERKGRSGDAILYRGALPKDQYAGPHEFSKMEQDVYALGIILLEVLLGEPLKNYSNPSFRVKYLQACLQQATRYKNIDDIIDLIRRMVSPDPSIRFNIFQVEEILETKVLPKIYSSLKLSPADYYQKFTPEDHSHYKRIFEMVTKEQIARMIRFIKLYGQPDINEQVSQQLTELFSNLHKLNSSNPEIAATAFSKVEFLFNDLINKTQFDRRFLLMWRDPKQRDSLFSFYQLAHNHVIKVYPTLVEGNFLKLVFLLDEAAKIIGKFLKIKEAINQLYEAILIVRRQISTLECEVFPNLTHPVEEQRIKAISRLQSIYENLIKRSQFDMKAILEIATQNKTLYQNLLAIVFNSQTNNKKVLISFFDVIMKAEEEISKLKQKKVIPVPNPYLPLYTITHQASFQPAQVKFFPTLFRDMVLLEKIEEDTVSVSYKAANKAEWKADGKSQGPFYVVKRYRKSLPPDQCDVVYNEIQTASCLQAICHPHLLKTHHLLRDEDSCIQLALVYEYRDLGDLEQFLAARKQRPLNSAEVTKIVRELVSAVAMLHWLHIVHQNLSTANILLFKGLRKNQIFIKLGDYRLAESSLPVDSEDRSGESKLYRGALPKDQYAGPHEFCKMEQDVYALGIILLEVMTGEPLQNYSDLSRRVKYLQEC